MTYSQKRLLLLSFFVSATFSLLAQSKNKTSDTLLTIVKPRYSFQYPKTWSVDTSKMFGVDALLRSPKTDNNDDFSENMNVFVQHLHGQNYSLTKMAKESEDQIKAMVTDLQIIESRFDSTASLPHYILRYKGRQGKFLLTTIQHYYLKDEIGYALTFTIKDGEEESYISIATKILNSFQLR